MKNDIIRSPLRYPGGKSRVSGALYGMFPEFEEYREPFVGGGSVFVETVQRAKGRRFWINDLFGDLYVFWKEMKSNPEAVIGEIRRIRGSGKGGRDTYESILSDRTESDVTKAAEFFALNRMTFSGTTMSGGFSNAAFEKRFTESSIDRCLAVAPLLKDVRITNLDYSELLSAEGNGVFIFMDPPYYIGSKSRLYGKKGNMHCGFDHDRFFEKCRSCRHRWMITYNDCEYLRDKWSEFRVDNLEFSYGMGSVKTGREITIRNY